MQANHLWSDRLSIMLGGTRDRMVVSQTAGIRRPLLCAVMLEAILKHAAILPSLREAEVDAIFHSFRGRAL